MRRNPPAVESTLYDNTEMFSNCTIQESYHEDCLADNASDTRTFLLRRSFRNAAPVQTPDLNAYTQDAAERMDRAASTTLAPVYAPLAEWLVTEFEWENLEGLVSILAADPET